MGVVALSEVVQEKRLASSNDRRLYAVWQALPARGAVDREQAEELGAEAIDRPGDFAASSALLTSLELLGALTSSKTVNGLLYRRSETFPDLPEDGHNGPGSDALNARLEEMAAEERRRNEVRDREAQRAFEEGPGRERRELIALIAEVVREEIGDGRITILEAELRGVKARLAELDRK